MEPIMKTPEYKLILEPEDGNPEYVIIEVKLPLIVSDRKLMVEKYKGRESRNREAESHFVRSRYL